MLLQTDYHTSTSSPIFYELGALSGVVSDEWCQSTKGNIIVHVKFKKCYVCVT